MAITTMLPWSTTSKTTASSINNQGHVQHATHPSTSRNAYWVAASATPMQLLRLKTTDLLDTWPVGAALPCEAGAGPKARPLAVPIDPWGDKGTSP